MVQGTRYNLPFRRRRKQKTDYKKRRALVLSRLPRMITRPSNKNITVQIVEATTTGDRVLASAYSKELIKKFGWQGGCGNLPTAYLTGFLAGSRSIQKGVKRAILDIGLKKATKGSRLFAALKGGIDAGLDIPHSETMLPEEPRIIGQHIAEYAQILSSRKEESLSTFTRYQRDMLEPDGMKDHFLQVKEKISKEFSK